MDGWLDDLDGELNGREENGWASCWGRCCGDEGRRNERWEDHKGESETKLHLQGEWEVRLYVSDLRRIQLMKFGSNGRLTGLNVMPLIAEFQTCKLKSMMKINTD